MSPWTPLGLLAWLPAVLAGTAALGLAILLTRLAWVFQQAPGLPTSAEPLSGETLTVVVPVYNEAANIEACLRSLLACQSPCSNWQVLVVDDGSSDGTPQLVQQLLQSRASSPPDCCLFEAGPRPAGERWVGKNRPCSQAMEQVSSDWVLFLDADVRLHPSALVRALAQASADQADLLSLAPRLSCGCLAEWMVQPIMASLLGLGFPIEAANDPASSVAFAAGPFMLFRRHAYTAIGGHRALAAEVVEDLALARRVKAAGYRLRYLLGLDAVELRMYANFAALWEGWTKNWLLGLDGAVPKALAASAVVALMFSVPWLLLAAIPAAAAFAAPLRPALASAWLLALLGIGLQWGLRLWTRQRFQVPLRYWWLMGAGGLIVAAIGPVSVWRTLTGRGWTWRGRSLA